MTQENQPTLFGSQEIAVPEIPKSREKALARAEKKHGIDYAHARAMSYPVNKDLNAAVDDRIKRIGTSNPRMIFVGINNQINAAVGAKVEQCDTEQLALRIYLASRFSKILRTAKTQDEDKKRRAEEAERIKALRKSEEPAEVAA